MKKKFVYKGKAKYMPIYFEYLRKIRGNNEKND